MRRVMINVSVAWRCLAPQVLAATAAWEEVQTAALTSWFLARWWIVSQKKVCVFTQEYNHVAENIKFFIVEENTGTNMSYSVTHLYLEEVHSSIKIKSQTSLKCSLVDCNKLLV